MLERSKWQKELVVFSRLVNTIVLTGNIYDQHPIVNEREQKIQGFCSLEVYLARTCQSLGYQAILFYNPIDGFYVVPGLQQKVNSVELLERIVSEANTEAQGNQGIVNLSKRINTQGYTNIFPECIEEAAHVVNLLLTRSYTSIAIILSFSSRMTARPDDLDMDERKTFMYLQEGAVNGKKNHSGDPESAGFQNNIMIQNQLFLVRI